MKTTIFRTARWAIGAALSSMLLAASAHAALTISTGATQNVTCSGGVCAATAADAVLNVTDLTNLLASAPLTIQSGSQAQDIQVEAPFKWKGANGLTLDAYRAITIDTPVYNAGPAPLSLITDDGGTGGELSFRYKGRIHFKSTENELTINGNKYILLDTIGTMAKAMTSPSRNYFFALFDNYDASADGRYGSSPVQRTRVNTVFEGLGNTISHLTIHGTFDQPTGLFGFVVARTTLADINIVDADVSSEDVTYIGILAGLVTAATIRNIHTSGSVKTEVPGGESVAGGLFGGTFSKRGLQTVVTNSSSSASVKMLNSGYAGGLIGAYPSDGILSHSYATGAISGGNYVFVGGIVGANYGVIENCYGRGSVTTGSSQESPPKAGAGGLTGLESGGRILDSYSTGEPSGGSHSALGGFIGYESDGIYQNGYWDTKTSHTNHAVGYGDDAGITGLTTKQFKSGLPADFDPNVWAEDPNIKNGYPYLIANPPVK